MATQNHQHLPDDSVDSQNLIDNFIEASLEKEKMHEFDLKYSVTQTQRLVQQDLGMSVLADLGASSTPSSSFQLLHQIITHLASGRGGSEHNMPRHGKDLIIRMLSPPPVTKEPAKASLGPKLRESESLGVHGEQTQGRNAAIINSNHSHNLSPTISTSNNSGNAATYTTSNLSVSPDIPVQQVNPVRPNGSTSMESVSFTIDMPIPSESPPVNPVRPNGSTSMESDSFSDMPIPSESPPHEDNHFGFTVFAAELVGALTNLAVSPRAKHDQLLIYVVVASSTLAFLISSTALLLHKKRPTTAKMMQRAAFLIGAFGFFGMMGMLLPASITWWFTISAFLVCLLMFIVATLIKILHKIISHIRRHTKTYPGLKMRPSMNRIGQDVFFFLKGDLSIRFKLLMVSPLTKTEKSMLDIMA